MVLVIHPAGSHYQTSALPLCTLTVSPLTWKLFFQVLIVLVAVLVEANEGSSLSITCVSSAFRSSSRTCLSKHTNVLYVRVPSVSRAYGRLSKYGFECIPASGGRIPVKGDQLALQIARKLWNIHTLKPILRRLRSVLISVDMAALSVSSLVSTSRESLIDDCQDLGRPFLL